MSSRGVAAAVVQVQRSSSQPPDRRVLLEQLFLIGGLLGRFGSIGGAKRFLQIVVDQQQFLFERLGDVVVDSVPDVRRRPASPSLRSGCGLRGRHRCKAKSAGRAASSTSSSREPARRSPGRGNSRLAESGRTDGRGTEYSAASCRAANCRRFCSACRRRPDCGQRSDRCRLEAVLSGAIRRKPVAVNSLMRSGVSSPVGPASSSPASCSVDEPVERLVVVERSHDVVGTGTRARNDVVVGVASESARVPGDVEPVPSPAFS